MATRIQVRRGTTSQWNTANPTLEEGEIGYNSTLGQMKIGDGSTVWGELDYILNSAALDTSLGSYIPDTEKSAIDGVAELDGSKNILAPAGIIFEGTANDHETTLSVTDPTADRTITFPDATGTVITTGNLSDITNAGTFTGNIVIEGATVDDYELTLSAGNPTADRTITFPDATGTVALTSDIAAGVVTETGTQTLTNKTLTSPVINTPTGITKTDVGLANVDNTTDANKPVSTATQTELNLKAPLASPTFTGTVTIPAGASISGFAPLADPAFTGTATAVNLTISGDLTVNGTTTNINSTNLVVEDKNIVLGDAATPTDTTADGGGITLKGATDKTFNWVDATDAWTSSEHINLASAKSLYLNGTLLKDVTETLTNKTLTSPKINEDVALTATATELNYVDGVTSAIQTQLDGKVDESLFDVKGDILVASADNTPAKLGVGTNGYILTANSSATNGIEWAAAPISLPSQSGNSGKYLTTDGTTASWGTVSSYSAPTIGSTSIASGATVTSIAGLTLSSPTITGSLTAGGGTGTSGQVLASTGSGVQWTTPAGGAAFSEFLLVGC